MYRGYQFIIAHIVMRCCTVEPQIATYQLSAYHILYHDPKGELCLICWLEMSWRLWKVMHRDLKCSNLLLDVSGRVTWRNILLASMTTTFSSHVAGPRLVPEFNQKWKRISKPDSQGEDIRFWLLLGSDSFLSFIPPEYHLHSDTLPSVNASPADLPAKKEYIYEIRDRCDKSDTVWAGKKPACCLDCIGGYTTHEGFK